jgi:hypothetical protein
METEDLMQHLATTLTVIRGFFNKKDEPRIGLLRICASPPLIGDSSLAGYIPPGF